jgi:hypothetical protein
MTEPNPDINHPIDVTFESDLKEFNILLTDISDIMKNIEIALNALASRFEDGKCLSCPSRVPVFESFSGIDLDTVVDQVPELKNIVETVNESIDVKQAKDIGDSINSGINKKPRSPLV